MSEVHSMNRVTSAPGSLPCDSALCNRAAKVIPGGMWGHMSAKRLPPAFPQFFRSAEGARITDVDDNTYIEYGVRANEAPIRDSIKSLAVFAAIEYKGESDTEQDMYAALVERVAGDLSVAGNDLIELQGEIGIKEELIVSVQTRQESVRTLTNNHINLLENVDYYEVSARFSQYTMQLEASYAITARVQNMSLVNFLR